MARTLAIVVALLPVVLARAPAAEASYQPPRVGVESRIWGQNRDSAESATLFARQALECMGAIRLLRAGIASGSVVFPRREGFSTGSFLDDAHWDPTSSSGGGSLGYSFALGPWMTLTPSGSVALDQPTPTTGTTKVQLSVMFGVEMYPGIVSAGGQSGQTVVLVNDRGEILETIGRVALGNAGRASSLALLTEAAKGPSPQPHVRAAEALRKLEVPRTQVILTELLRDEEENIVAAAMKTHRRYEALIPSARDEVLDQAEAGRVAGFALTHAVDLVERPGRPRRPGALAELLRHPHLGADLRARIRRQLEKP